MEKYTKKFRENNKQPMVHKTDDQPIEPFRDAQKYLRMAQFSLRERETFFDETFVDIMSDLFGAWLKTEPHAVKEREYLWHCAMSLGSVKQRLIGYEQGARNATHVINQQSLEAEEAEKGNKQ